MNMKKAGAVVAFVFVFAYFCTLRYCTDELFTPIDTPLPWNRNYWYELSVDPDADVMSIHKSFHTQVPNAIYIAVDWSRLQK